MGVPAFFRWLCTRFPKIIIDVIENEDETIDGVQVPTDTSKANPNNIEFDCLYLDMNGIIHPCTHPENETAPLTEEQMMTNIMNYVDRMFSIVRPRKLLYMAIDGVAPRAKMNQQRSRRFKSRKEAKEKLQKQKKEGVMEEEQSSFDSNCITPGTEFMEKVTQYLRYYIALRQSTDPGWRGVKVVLSDSNAPGEGEHKIMHYIRYQRAQPDYDPNLRHDADLIMLGLSTHEPHFTILREVVTVGNNNGCFICGQPGHLAFECKGKPKEEEKPVKKKPFQFLHLSVLREYLDQWLFTDNLKFEYDFERVIDDWVFLCFFVGNDFLPHLPTLEIRENALDLLTQIYKDVYPRVGYLTSSGELLLDRIDSLVSEIAKLEDQILVNRLRKQAEKEQRERNRKSELQIQNEQNMAAAVQLRSQLLDELGSVEIPQKQPNEIVDLVRLGEEGWKERYYKTKFGVEMDNKNFFDSIRQSYVEGLVWVYRYYYQGCTSWKWFYSFHYAPFASEITGLSNVKIDFSLGEPFSPLEQLMAVLPADSGGFLPPAYRELMTSPDSPILDLYPTDFVIEPEKNKPAWTWVALLPFIDEQRLVTAIKSVEKTLTPEEKARDELRDDILSIHFSSNLAQALSKTVSSNWIALEPSVSPSFSGYVALLDANFKTDVFQPPKDSTNCQPVNHPTVMLKFKIAPLHTFSLKFGLLHGAIPPPRVLSSKDFFNSTRREHQNSAANRMINHAVQSRQHKMPHHVQERRQHQPHPYGKGSSHRDKHDDHKQKDFRNYHNNYESKRDEQSNYYQNQNRNAVPPQFTAPQFNPGPQPIPFGMPLPGPFVYPQNMYPPNANPPQNFSGGNQQHHGQHGHQDSRHSQHHNSYHKEHDPRKRKY